MKSTVYLFQEIPVIRQLLPSRARWPATLHMRQEKGKMVPRQRNRRYSTKTMTSYRPTHSYCRYLSQEHVKISLQISAWFASSVILIGVWVDVVEGTFFHLKWNQIFSFGRKKSSFAAESASSLASFTFINQISYYALWQSRLRLHNVCIGHECVTPLWNTGFICISCNMYMSSKTNHTLFIVLWGSWYHNHSM